MRKADQRRTPALTFLSARKSYFSAAEAQTYLEEHAIQIAEAQKLLADKANGDAEQDCMKMGGQVYIFHHVIRDNENTLVETYINTETAGGERFVLKTFKDKQQHASTIEMMQQLGYLTATGSREGVTDEGAPVKATYHLSPYQGVDLSTFIAKQGMLQVDPQQLALLPFLIVEALQKLHGGTAPGYKQYAHNHITREHVLVDVVAGKLVVHFCNFSDALGLTLMTVNSATQEMRAVDLRLRGDEDYRAPELKWPTNAFYTYTPSSDIFSLGRVLWKLIDKLFPDEEYESYKTALKELIVFMLQSDPDKRALLSGLKEHLMEEYCRFLYQEITIKIAEISKAQGKIRQTTNNEDSFSNIIRDIQLPRDLNSSALEKVLDILDKYLSAIKTFTDIPQYTSALFQEKFSQTLPRQIMGIVEKHFQLPDPYKVEALTATFDKIRHEETWMFKSAQKEAHAVTGALHI